MRALALLALAGCYSGSRAAGDVNAAWRGHARVDVEAKLGAPTAVVAQADGTSVLAWSRTGINVASLPSGSLRVDITPASFDFHAEAQPGVVEKYQFDVAKALVDRNGMLVRFESETLAAGIPKRANIHTGIIYGASPAFGFHKCSMRHWRPSLGAYMGGMIGPRTALLGAYQFVNAGCEDGSPVGHTWAFAVQYWPLARLNIRGGAGMVLDDAVWLREARLSPGILAAASFAVLRVGSLVVDVRFDSTVSTKTAFGMFGVGVNVN
jgi:hypothetical protein